ncbi:hypothetical protein [Rhizobium leguminosarum]|uniref:hypothetical protein n=1 Tax=Rhizobium leguminosarum TaxID=384 RepID=UPI00103FD35F|nr:hypothetical protein [Rhizobium leguminosarum]TBY27420.1 hypothetical protein E0H55_27400 [Rhizobium leguminosarum bv. viciae]
MKPKTNHTSSPIAGVAEAFAKIAEAAGRQPADVELVDGGTMEERMKAEGWWDLAGTDLRASMRRNGRVILHVDRKTGCILGFHFEKTARTH